MASGNQLGGFLPMQGEPPATNYATLDTRNGIPVLDFDATTEETMIFSDYLPPNYGGGGLHVDVDTMASSAVTGDFVVGVSFERWDNATDHDADSFATEVTATSTTSGTSGVETTTRVSLSNSQIDGLLAGERYRLRLARRATGNTMAGDLEFAGMILLEQ